MGEQTSETLGGVVSQYLTMFHVKIPNHLGFPGSSVVKNPSADAGDVSSIPGSGR